MRLTDSISLCVLAWMLQATVPDAPSATGKHLFSDDFREGMARWVAEMEKPATIQARGNVLDLDAPAGCTLWYRPELQSPLMIQYEARMVQAGGGPNVRVSDLNAFWMATEARSPNDLFATKRSGKFSEYNQFRTYYVGQGGNSNTTTRYRRCGGSAPFCRRTICIVRTSY